jgi:hypothetical protein
MKAVYMNDNKDYVREFLYGTSDQQFNRGRTMSSIYMDERMEGWIGIPHGGISMGIMMDLALSLNHFPKNNKLLFPLIADFRLGGASLKIGNTLHFQVAPNNGGAKGEATVDGDPLPYMSASIDYGKEDVQQRDRFASFIPEHIDEVMTSLTLLPSYKKCFVCGFERNHPGLKRKFYRWDNRQGIVIAHTGFRSEDSETFYLFQRGGHLHPLPFLALLDETLGWGGFLISSSGAVTVKIGYTFYRPVSINEKIVFFGRGDRVRGKAGSRLLFWASGGAAAVKEDGRLDMVVSSSGQWFGVQDLTEQMKTALLPKELMDKAFSFAKAHG